MPNIRDITQQSYNEWLYHFEHAKSRGVTLEYFLSIVEADYSSDLYSDCSLIKPYILREGIFNSVKSLLGIRTLTDIYEPSFNFRLNQKTPRLGVTLSKSDANYLISIEDNGPGITPENMQNIFRRGFSTFGTSGLGLNAMLECVNNFEGKIHFSSTPFVSTKLEVSLPIRI